MKSIKQIRENYNLVVEKEEADIKKLTALGRAGLFDMKKINFIKRALEKDPKEMTLAERKILIQLLEELMSQVLHSSQVYTKVKQNVMQGDIREEVLDEVSATKTDYLSKFDPRSGSGWPSEKDMPNVLILRRKAIRVFPGQQKVALYYSQALDRYISVPFGAPNLGIAEGVSKQYQDATKKKKDKSDSRSDQEKEVSQQYQDATENTEKNQDATENTEKKKKKKDKSDYKSDKERAAKVIELMKSGQKRKAVRDASDLTLSSVGVGSQPGALQARKAIGAAARKKLGQDLAGGDIHQAATTAGFLAGKAIRSGLGYLASPAKYAMKKTANQYKQGYEGLKKDVADSSLVKNVKTGIGNVRLGRQAAKSDKPHLFNPKGTDKKFISPSASFAHRLGKLSGKIFEEDEDPDRTDIRSGLRRFFGIQDDPEHDNKPENKKFNRYVNTTAKALNDPVVGTVIGGGGAGLVGKKIATTLMRRAARRTAGKELLKNAGKGAVALTGAAAGALGGAMSGGEQDIKEPKAFSLQAKISKAERSPSDLAVQQKQQNLFNKQLKQSLQEDAIAKIKNVTETTQFHIGEQNIVINKNIAEKIVSLYESVNKQNKKKIESMLGESVESFKKIVEFAVRQ